MEQEILSDANYNTVGNEPQKWTKITSFSDLLALQSKMSDQHSVLLDDPIERQKIAFDIEQGLTFGFWFNNDGKLCFDR